ncbi:unnamed protein product [Orchesella dallaii]|uniref:Uncharacterized protein n=1 Tax=Orchesella dallaii TaxID=48710 RepID=A0ABP1QYC1_9HEXA
MDPGRFRKTAKIVGAVDIILQVLYMVTLLTVCAITQSSSSFDDILEDINKIFRSSSQYWIMDSSSPKSQQATKRIFVILWIYAAVDCIVSLSQICAAIGLILSAHPAREVKSSSKLATIWFVYNIIWIVLNSAWRVYIQFWVVLVIAFIIRVCLLALGYKFLTDIRAARDEENFKADPNTGVNGVNLNVPEPIPLPKREKPESNGA